MNKQQTIESLKKAWDNAIIEGKKFEAEMLSKKSYILVPYIPFDMFQNYMNEDGTMGCIRISKNGIEER